MVRLFQNGERVVHLAKGKAGKIIDFIGGEDRRYYVDHSGSTWSVPERGLDSETLKTGVKKIKGLQASKNVESPLMHSDGAVATRVSPNR